MFRSAPILLACLLFTGCHSNSAQPDLQHLSDDALVHLNQQGGLGLGLKITGRTFHSGQQIPVHMALEDIASPTPVSAGLCSGLALAWTNLVSNDGGFVQIHTNPHCFQPPDPDEQALAKGKLLTFDVTGQQYAPLNLQPGLYQLNISWQRYPAGPGTLLTRRPGAVIMSNPITVTIKP